MNTKKIPEGWEECAPSECTQVWISLAGSMLPANRSLDHDMVVRINGEWISEGSWPILGIIPIRKSPPPEPIEFVVEYPEYYKGCAEEPVGSVLTLAPQGVKPGMKFRQVVED